MTSFDGALYERHALGSAGVCQAASRAEKAEAENNLLLGVAQALQETVSREETSSRPAGRNRRARPVVKVAPSSLSSNARTARRSPRWRAMS